MGPRTLFAIACIVGVGLRLYLAAAFEGNTDERYWELIASILRRGGNQYTDPAVPTNMPYGYSPVWAQTLHLFDRITEASSLPLHFIVRGTLTIVDTVNAALIGTIARRATGASWHRGFAVYYLNPVAILLVGYHGQLETLAAVPLLAALALGGRAGGAAIWALGTASLLLKHILAFQVWTLFWYALGPIARIAALTLSVLVFALSLAPYFVNDPTTVADKMLGHGGLPGIYGTSSFLPYGVSVVLFIVVMTSLPLVMRRWGLPVVSAMRFSAVTFLALIFGIGEQYFLIPVLFGAAVAGRWYWIYSGVATLFLLSSFENVNVLPLPRVWNAVWLAALAWTASEALAGVQGAARPSRSATGPERIAEDVPPRPA